MRRTSLSTLSLRLCRALATASLDCSPPLTFDPSRDGRMDDCKTSHKNMSCKWRNCHWVRKLSSLSPLRQLGAISDHTVILGPG
ncbi:hypothetical protein EJ03DRAFT_66876 [Teratosphaeria nubilosa]|uniref:Secreted protein n=1 Tax=Teratosphaeria nubilosa TaxID=161662 RepID=A0A6G1LC17_9PEZI|nr:hypothetical protein EJ03DRAFT_66876 [Teratosphaeria nubilosa]